MQALRDWQRLLDSAFRVPGTSITVWLGSDHRAGSLGGGDLLTALISCALSSRHTGSAAAGRAAPHADEHRASTSLIGIVPFVGDVADVFWKSNTRNLALLEHHAARPQPATAGRLAVCCRRAERRLSLVAVFRARVYWLLHARRTGRCLIGRSPGLPAVARQLRRHARQAGAVAARDVSRSPRGCARPTGRARRAVRVRQRTVFPRQADLRATVRRAARAGQPDRRQRRARHHAERRPAAARTRWSPPPRSQAFAGARRRIRTTRATGGRSSGARGRCAESSAPTATSCCSAASPRPSTSTFCSAIFGDAAAVSGRLRRPRRHEPRRAAAAAGARRASSSTTCRSPARCGTVRGRRSCRHRALTGIAARDGTGRRDRRRSKRARDPARPTTTSSPVDGREVRLTNLRKLFWPDLGITKGDLLQYYADVADVLLPHLRDRAMVMKRYPHGAAGEFFFMKRAPSPRPDWIEICSIEHGSGNVIDFPMIQDLASLLWVDQSRLHRSQPVVRACDDVDRPDYLHFDLDPAPAPLRAGARDRADRARGARRAEDAVGREDHRLEGLTSTCRSCAARCRSRSGRSPRRWPRSWPRATRR